MLEAMARPFAGREFSWLLVLLVAIFLLDLFSPLGYAVWILYLIPLQLAFRLRRPRFVPVTAAVCSGFIVMGYFASPPGIEPAVAIVNDSVGILTLWIVTFILQKQELAEQGLQQSKEQLGMAQLGAAVGVWEWHTSTNRLIWTPELEALYGLSPGTVRDYEDFRRRVHPDDLGKMEADRDDAIRQRRPFDLEFRIILPTGDVRWILAHGRAFYDEAGRPVRTLGNNLDVTKRKQAEEALRVAYDLLEQRIKERTAELEASREQLEIAIDNGNLAAWDWNIRTGAVRFGDRWARMRGFEPGEVEPHVRAWQQGIHPDDRPVVEQRVKACLDGESREYEAEIRVKTRAGDWIWILDRGRVVERDADGRPVRMAGVEIDITSLKLSQQEQARSEQFITSVVEHLPAMIFVKDADSLRFVRFNRAGEELLGYDRSELLGKSDYDFFPREEAEFFVKKDRETLTSGGVLDIPEEPIQTRHRGMRILHTRKIPILDEKGKPKFLLGISQDITERKEADKALKDAFERLRDVTRQLTEVEEVERRRLARELHDEFGQALTGLKFDLAWVKKKLAHPVEADEGAMLQDKLTRMSESVDRLMQTVRHTVAVLRPGLLDDLGPVAAIEWLASSFRDRTGLPCECRIDPALGEQAIQAEVATAVFRCAQELLTNVMRHAHASRASVGLTVAGDRLQLTVADDGCGMQERSWESVHSLGLRGLRERVQLLGGRADIVSVPDAGTEVRVFLPLSVGVTGNGDVAF